MAKFYKPQLPYNTRMILLIPTKEKVKGTIVKRYPEVKDGLPINVSFKTYGGTEIESNGVLVIEDTANVETFFRPDIKADCQLVLMPEQYRYDIISEPENINRQNQFLKFKVRKVKGGA